MKFFWNILLIAACAAVSASAFADEAQQPVARGQIEKVRDDAKVIRPRLHITFNKPANEIVGTDAKGRKALPVAMFKMKKTEGKPFRLPIAGTINLSAKKGGARK